MDVKHGYGEEEGNDFSYKGHFLLGKRQVLECVCGGGCVCACMYACMCVKKCNSL